MGFEQKTISIWSKNVVKLLLVFDRHLYILIDCEFNVLVKQKFKNKKKMFRYLAQDTTAWARLSFSKELFGFRRKLRSLLIIIIASGKCIIIMIIVFPLVLYRVCSQPIAVIKLWMLFSVNTDNFLPSTWYAPEISNESLFRYS